MVKYSTTFFSDVNLAPNVEVCTVVWIFDDHIVGVNPTNEDNPVIDIPVILLSPWQ